MSAPPPLIRSASLADADALWPLVRDFATSFEPDRDAFVKLLPELLARDDVHIVVAESPGADPGIIGYLLATLHPTFFANGPVAGVEEVMVASSHRRAGVGAALLADAERWADARGAGYLSLASRRAGEFYLALGFEESATFYKKTASSPAAVSPPS